VPHGGQDGADTAEGAVYVGLELVEQVVHGQLVQRPPDLEAGVVHRHVDIARLPERLTHRLIAAHVQGHEREGPAVIRRDLRQVAALVEGPHRGDHAIAAARQQLGGRAADAAVGAGDEHRLLGHLRLPSDNKKPLRHATGRA